jgi:endogenous inhibitor of DNA gyrase (YacG/DUF329 family)
MTDRSSPPLRAVRIAAKCPICSKPAEAQYQPFCSKRCANIDLGRWLKEGYRVETEEGPGEEEPGRGTSQDGAGRPSGQRG